MAILDSSTVNFTGPLGDVVFYRVRGSDKIFVRRKGGASKDRLHKAPEFVNTRRTNSEFSGRSRASRYIMQMLHLLKPLADYNIAGPLNALLKPIQELDTQSEWGKRNVVLSLSPRVLEGFSLNRLAAFESVVRPPLSFTLSKETLSASIDIPSLVPGINFFPPQKHAWYGFIATLGVVPDLYFNERTGYIPTNEHYEHLSLILTESAWYPTSQGSAPTQLNLAWKTPLPDKAFSLMLSIGLRYGVPQGNDRIGQVRHAGFAKIIGVE